MISKQKLTNLKNYFNTHPVEVVYLFGSEAKNKTTKHSDTDLAVLFKPNLSKEKKFDLRLKMITQTSLILNQDRIDLIDLEEAPVALQRSAIESRKTILSKNKTRQVLFEAQVNSRYFDHVYFIKQNTKISLASIAGM